MTDITQLPGPSLPLLGSDELIVYRNGVPYKTTQSEATLGTIDLGIEIAATADSVVATAATDDAPFGFTEAQANAIIAELNKVIANQNNLITAMQTAGWLTIAE